MELKISLTQRDKDALLTVIYQAEIQASERIAGDDSDSIKIGYELLHGLSLIKELLKMSNSP